MLGRVFLGWTSSKLGLICLVQGHNAVTPVRLEPAAPRSRVKHSTTEPLSLWAPIRALVICNHWLNTQSLSAKNGYHIQFKYLDPKTNNVTPNGYVILDAPKGHTVKIGDDRCKFDTIKMLSWTAITAAVTDLQAVLTTSRAYNYSSKLRAATLDKWTIP